MVLMVLVQLGKEVRTYRVQYNDCSKPTNLSKLSIYTVCTEEKKQMSQPKKYHILQMMRDQKLTGYKCQVKYSRFEMYCGAFSHEKIIKIPVIEVVEEISIQACRDMINTNKYITEYGTTHGIEMGKETVISVSDVGVLHTSSDGKISCQGQQMKIGDQVVEQVLVLSQYRITLEKEEFLTTSTYLVVRQATSITRNREELC